MLIFTILIFIISTAALFASLISLRALSQAGMLDKKLLTKNGFKNTFAYLLWILMWVGSIALFFKQSWGILSVQIGLVMLLIFVILLGIGKVVGLVQMGKAEPIKEVDDEGSEEIVDYSRYWDEDWKAHILKGIVINLAMTTLLSILIIWSLTFLAQAKVPF